MQRFKSPGQAQDFLSAHAFIYGHFRPRRHRLSAADYRRVRTKAIRTWRQETSVQQVGQGLMRWHQQPKLVLQSVNLAVPFLSAHAIIYGHFRPRRHRLNAVSYRRVRTKAFGTWRQETCVRQVR